MDWKHLRIDPKRLTNRIEALGRVGSLPGGGVCRLALTDEDKAGRDLVVSWMETLGLAVSVDRIGNIFGMRPGKQDGPPVATGSHIDTVRTGGYYDGNLGVLAGLEVAAVLKDAGLQTEHGFCVGVFTNEEGARFQPDMMGSMCFQGGLPLEKALATVGIDGLSVGEELNRIGYAGNREVGFPLKAFLELHVEQGPLLEQENTRIGCVTGVQGISWQEVTIEGVSNHAGTTPMRLRTDAGYAASAVAVGVRRIAREMGGDQVGTVGSIKLYPDLINVVANKATMTIDLRNTDEALLQEAEQRARELLARVAEEEGVSIKTRELARFEPAVFDPVMIDLVETTTRELGFSNRRMPAGAGHDAGLITLNYPTAMIFTPSVGGISHNIEEYTEPEDIEAGANVLLQALLKLLMKP
ncbi:MAG: Zn-dependent hydrolase [Acidobacteriota bacterium]|nr:Zn-dependent hydrolase [Acidobacteriota bacterium]